MMSSAFLAALVNSVRTALISFTALRDRLAIASTASATLRAPAVWRAENACAIARDVAAKICVAAETPGMELINPWMEVTTDAETGWNAAIVTDMLLNCLV